MAKRGRASADSLAIMPTMDDSRLTPPDGLSEAEIDLFLDTVNRLPRGWFPPEAVEHLAAYCRHAVASADLSRMIHCFSPDWLKVEGGLERLDRLMRMRERETRAMMACARALRLTNQSRYDPRAAARGADKPRGKRPWDSDKIISEPK